MTIKQGAKVIVTGGYCNDNSDTLKRKGLLDGTRYPCCSFYVQKGYLYASSITQNMALLRSDTFTNSHIRWPIDQLIVIDDQEKLE